MANLSLELNINSASNLLNVNLITKMDVYTVITIHDKITRKKQKAKTNVHPSGGSNPTWNHPVKFPINERLVHEGRLTLTMGLVSRRLLGKKSIGKVKIPLLELFNSVMPSTNSDVDDQDMKFMMYQVRTHSGKRSGVLYFSYRFKPNVPMTVNRSLGTTTYPLPSGPSPIEQPTSTSPELSFEFPNLSQPSDQNGYEDHTYPFAVGPSNDYLPVSYGDVMTEQPYLGLSPYDNSGHAPPPPSYQGYGQYGYAPPSPPRSGYGSPSYQQQKGIGFGVGLGAGLLGGLIVGDIVSDVANSFDL